MAARFELRRFRPGDGAAVWALHDTALEDAGVHGGHGPWEADLRDIRSTYIRSGGDFVVALGGGELIAMGGLLPISISGEVGEIKRMRVHPARQRQGLGRLILDSLEERAGDLGFDTIQLDTTAGQVAARRLYEGAGYEETGRRADGPFIFIDYRKRLARF